MQDLLLGYPPDSPPTDDDVREWIQRRSADPNERFLVISGPDKSCCGYVQLTSIHWKGGYGNVGVAVAPEARHKGWAKRAVAELLSQATSEIGLRKAMAEIRADNIASLTLFKTLGFDQVGMLQDHYKGYGVAIMEKLMVASLKR